MGREEDVQRGELVDVAVDFEVSALIPEVANHEADSGSQFMLNVEIPGLYVRVFEVWDSRQEEQGLPHLRDRTALQAS